MADRIVVPGGYTLHPDDISWAGFEELGEFTAYDQTEEDAIPGRAAGHASCSPTKSP